MRKLKRLPLKTRKRKLALLLREAELGVERGERLDLERMAELLVLARDEAALGRPSLRDLERFLGSGELDPQALRRIINSAYHALLRSLGAEPAEWDFLAPESGALDPGFRTVLPFSVYLEEIRSPYNVGAIFRTGEAFGVGRILLSPDTPSPLHPRAARTARGTVSLIPWSYEELSVLEDREGVFALELGGTPLEEFPFPGEGTLLIGSEELGLSPEALELASHKAGRVSILMGGAKRSLNVSVAFGIVMQAWFSSLRENESGSSAKRERKHSSGPDSSTS